MPSDNIETLRAKLRKKKAQLLVAQHLVRIQQKAEMKKRRRNHQQTDNLHGLTINSKETITGLS